VLKKVYYFFFFFLISETTFLSNILLFFRVGLRFKFFYSISLIFLFIRLF
jgi:hypothetical protein